ncbi:MAG: Universal stress protein family protein [Acidimicrobiales bacterium]|jgi:nucleotide-binding universal stress UspA family protein|nr:Universal stress protein family protein [Acidimicrobiales bacterium]
MASTIVVGVDGTDDSLAALAAAAELGEESGAALVVVHVRHESWMVSAAVMEPGAQPAMKDTLDAVEKTTRERATAVFAGRSVRWRFDVALGDPATELIAAARNNGATAIVVGGRSHGVVGGLVLGSVVQKLVRHSPVSLLVVRDGQAHRLHTIASGAPGTGTG